MSKDLQEFYESVSWCKKCILEKFRVNKYSLDDSDIERMMKEQDGRCAICFQILGMPSVDHDHVTGQNRGLLCKNCNTGLGMFKDSIRNLASAIVYLESYGKKFS